MIAADKNKDAALAKQCLAWILKAEQQFGKQLNYGHFIGDALARLEFALLQQSGVARRARAFGDVVGVTVDRSHCRCDLVVANPNDTRRTLADDLDCVRVGHPAGHAIREGVGRWSFDEGAGFEGRRHSVGAIGHHADHFGRQAQHVAHADHA